MTLSCAVVIPTRNRSALAKNAIGSVLGSPSNNVQLFVSDNSTAPGEKQELASFCARLADKRLKYITPPEPLPMPRHWEFALAHAQTHSCATHFVILTD